MPYETKYVPGQHNVQCCHCKGIYKSGVMKRQWNGYLACYTCWDPDPRPMFKGTTIPADKEMQIPKVIQKEEDDQKWHYQEVQI